MLLASSVVSHCFVGDQCCELLIAVQDESVRLWSACSGACVAVFAGELPAAAAVRC